MRVKKQNDFGGMKVFQKVNFRNFRYFDFGFKLNTDK